MSLSFQKTLHRPRGWAAVFFGAERLEFTAVRGAGALASIEKEATAPVPVLPDASSPTEGWPAAAEALRQQFDAREHHVVTAIGGEDVLCQTLRLPTTKADELKQMLELQLDTLTPLPPEDIVYSFEPLETTATDTRVLVAVARKAAVNDRVGALEAAGLPAEIVAVDALAVFRALVQRELLPRDEKLNTLVQLTPAAAHVIVFAHSQPLIVRSLALPADADRVATMREELQRTLFAAEVEQPGGVLGKLTFTAWPEKLRADAETLAAGWAENATCLLNGSVPSPALSLCLETATRETGPRLNLLPDEWRQRRRKKQQRKLLIRGAIAVAVLYLIALGVFLTLVGMKQANLQRLDAQIASRQKRYNDARALHNELLAMQKQIDTKYAALEVLREITVLMPEGLKLSSFVFKKDQTVTLRGQAASANMANDFISRLEKCELFAQVKTLSERTEQAGLTKIEVLCSLKSAGLPATGKHGTQ